MKIGDLVKYRNRIPSDPHPKDAGEHGAWGNMGIVVKIFLADWGLKYDVPSIEYIDFDGDFIICKDVDLEVIDGNRQ